MATILAPPTRGPATAEYQKTIDSTDSKDVQVITAEGELNCLGPAR
jgi:hypothetical protein